MALGVAAATTTTTPTMMAITTRSCFFFFFFFCSCQLSFFKILFSVFVDVPPIGRSTSTVRR